jgi:hypothetical protein
MTLHSHLALVPLKRKSAAMGMRAPRAPSIVDVFSLLPSLVSVAGSVAPEDCHLALVAARALLAAIREGAQNDNTLATIPDELTGVETAVRWPRYGGPELPPHVGRSNSRAQ